MLLWLFKKIKITFKRISCQSKQTLKVLYFKVKLCRANFKKNCVGVSVWERCKVRRGESVWVFFVRDEKLTTVNFLWRLYLHFTQVPSISGLKCKCTSFISAEVFLSNRVYFWAKYLRCRQSRFQYRFHLSFHEAMKIKSPLVTSISVRSV